VSRSRLEYESFQPLSLAKVIVISSSVTKLSLIVPVYNEEKIVKRNLQEIINFLEGREYSWEVIVVDDGSHDRTVEIVSKFVRPNIKLIKSGINMGKGAALRRGVLASKGKYVIFTDVDLSVPIEFISPVLASLESGSDVAIGSRRVKGADIVRHQPLFRELMGRFHTFLARYFTRVQVSDFTCGFKGFRDIAAKKVFSQSLIDRWSYDDEILFLASKYEYKISEIPVKWINRDDSRVILGSAMTTSFLDLVKIRLNDINGKYEKLFKK